MDRDRFTIGGAMWINLANTVVMKDNKRTDILEDPGTTYQWLAANELLTEDFASKPEPESIHEELVSLRQLCLDALADLQREERLSDQTYNRLAREAEDVTVDIRIDRREGHPVIVHEGRSYADRVRYAVLISLTDTLGKYPAERIRVCEHEACILHFIDTSKSGRRRWCSMDKCGNRKKAAEFYMKKKERTGR